MEALLTKSFYFTKKLMHKNKTNKQIKQTYWQHKKEKSFTVVSKVSI